MEEKNKNLAINLILLIIGIVITIAGIFFIETNKRSILGQIVLLVGLVGLVYSIYRIISTATKN